MITTEDKPVRIVACGVFKPALEYLGVRSRVPGLRITYLPTNLHVNPKRLRANLLNHLTRSGKRGERVVCLYGDCFPDISEECRRRGTEKIQGCHCYELLLGRERFRRIMDETAGTYFLERDLLVDFEKCCLEPLELYDDEMRRFFFHHYQRLLYVRQPLDEDLLTKAGELANFLELALEVRDADYAALESEILSLLTRNSGSKSRPVNGVTEKRRLLWSPSDE